MRTIAFIALLAIVSVVVPVTSAVGEEEPQGLSLENTTVMGALVDMAKRLPSVWKMSRQGKKVAKSLPDYDGEVSVPDSELIYSWIEGLCQTPHRRPGTEYGHQAEQWVYERFEEMGLENVSIDPVPITVWEPGKWSLTVEGEKMPSFFVLNTGFTGEDGVTAPMVYVGTGKEKDYSKKDVAGKIVVAEVPFPRLPSGLLLETLHSSYYVSDPTNSINLGSSQYLNFVRQNFTGHVTEMTAPDTDVYWNAVKNDAAGILLILKDQPSGSNSHYGPYDGVMKPLPGLWIGKYEGERLRELARSGAEATLTLTGTKAPGIMNNVWGTLPGMSDDVILVTSHHDSPFEGASEDGAGVAQVLAQAWAWSRVPIERRPKTMVFVADAGHFYDSQGGHHFARTHKDIMERTDILITLEHLGAKEVEEDGRSYAETGALALTVMFTSHDPTVVGSVIKSLERKPPKATASIPSDFFAEAPTSDASGYVIESGVPVISWIGCPYYLLDEHDTLDKIEVDELSPLAESVTEIVKTWMAID